MAHSSALLESAHEALPSAASSRVVWLIGDLDYDSNGSDAGIQSLPAEDLTAVSSALSASQTMPSLSTASHSTSTPEKPPCHIKRTDDSSVVTSSSSDASISWGDVATSTQSFDFPGLQSTASVGGTSDGTSFTVDVHLTQLICHVATNTSFSTSVCSTETLAASDLTVTATLSAVSRCKGFASLPAVLIIDVCASYGFAVNHCSASSA